VNKEHHVVYVPGLHDQHPLNRNLAKLLPLFWKSHGFYGHVVTPHWEEGNRFAPKLALITVEVDRLASERHTVFIIVARIFAFLNNLSSSPRS